MHRRRDHLGRFLPRDYQEDPFDLFNPQVEEPQSEKEEEEAFENPFVDAQEHISSSSSEESLHLNDLFAELEYQDNLLALIIYQPPPLGPPPRMAAQDPFPFPIPQQQGNQNLKNIPTIALPKFYGLLTEDLKTFLFEFGIPCQSYDYTTDAHKLKLFPSTLKEVSLRWFMGLGTNVVAD